MFALTFARYHGLMVRPESACKGVEIDGSDIQAERQQAQEGSRFPFADEHEERPQGIEGSPAERPQSVDGIMTKTTAVVFFQSGPGQGGAIGGRNDGAFPCRGS